MNYFYKLMNKFFKCQYVVVNDFRNTMSFPMVVKVTVWPNGTKTINWYGKMYKLDEEKLQVCELRRFYYWLT